MFLTLISRVSAVFSLPCVFVFVFVRGWLSSSAGHLKILHLIIRAAAADPLVIFTPLFDTSPVSATFVNSSVFHFFPAYTFSSALQVHLHLVSSSAPLAPVNCSHLHQEHPATACSTQLTTHSPLLRLLLHSSFTIWTIIPFELLVLICVSESTVGSLKLP